jgi:hypothetical protein
MTEKPDNRLTIDFTGLCVLVTKDAPKGLKVILACAPMEKEAKEHAMPMAGEGMVHRPILSFNVKYLSRFKGKTPIQVIQLPNGDQIASWDLSNRIVRMKEWSGAYPRDLRVCRGTASLGTCPADPVSEMDLRWIPSLKEVSGSGEVIPEYLTEDPRPASGATALAARFDCPAGHLFANALVNRQADMKPWSFKVANKPVHTQYLADSARLELQSSVTGRVTFEAFAFGRDRQTASETLDLMPKEGRVEISISNLPVTLPKGDSRDVGMQHFSIYYSLLKNPRRRPEVSQVSHARYKTAAVSRSPGAVLNAHPHGIYPIKCTPSMVP